MGNQGEELLYTFKKTRKAYIVEYGCGIFFLFLPTVLMIKGIRFKNGIGNLFFVLGLVSLLTAEYSRFLTRYKVTPDKMIITHGVIKQKKKNVYFAPLGFLPNFNIKQNRIGRLLNYGSILISTGANEENNFKITDVNRPNRILEIIEELVERGRKKSHGLLKEGE